VISPVQVNILPGGTQQFTATDEATGGVASVIWTVAGSQSAGTTIDQTGLLTISQNETAQILIVTAVLNANNSKYASATANITANPELLLGDVNGDKKITIADVTMIYQHTRGKVALTGDALLAANVNGDSKITIADVTLVYQYTRGKITSFS
jgi:hypothetical protein